MSSRTTWRNWNTDSLTKAHSCKDTEIQHVKLILKNPKLTPNSVNPVSYQSLGVERLTTDLSHLHSSKEHQQKRWEKVFGTIQCRIFCD